MADPIREALERLLAADDFVSKAGPEYAQARNAARAILAAQPPAPSEEELAELAEEFHGDPAPVIFAALARWGHVSPAGPPAPAAGEVG